MNGIQFIILLVVIAFVAGPTITETSRLLKEIKTLLEVIEKRGRK